MDLLTGNVYIQICVYIKMYTKWANVKLGSTELGCQKTRPLTAKDVTAFLGGMSCQVSGNWGNLIAARYLVSDGVYGK